MGNPAADNPKRLIIFWALAFGTLGLCWMARTLFGQTGVWNEGIALGITLPTKVIVGLSSALIILLTTWANTRPNLSNLAIIGSAITVGGGMSNLLDRFVSSGKVLDYIKFFEIGHFNLADIFVAFGLTILLYNWWKQDQDHG